MQEEQDLQSQEQKAKDAVSMSLGSDFATPLGIIMMTVAGMIDLTAFVFLLFGIWDFGISGMLGLVFLAPMMYLHNSSLPKKKRGKLGKRVAIAFALKSIPFLGAIAPYWTIAAFLQLKSK